MQQSFAMWPCHFFLQELKSGSLPLNSWEALGLVLNNRMWQKWCHMICNPLLRRGLEVSSPLWPQEWLSSLRMKEHSGREAWLTASTSFQAVRMSWAIPSSNQAARWLSVLVKTKHQKNHRTHRIANQKRVCSNCQIAGVLLQRNRWKFTQGYTTFLIMSR